MATCTKCGWGITGEVNQPCGVCAEKEEPAGTVNIGEYMETMAGMQGASVATVKDGWVFLFTKELLVTMLAKAEVEGHVILQVKSSALRPKD